MFQKVVNYMFDMGLKRYLPLMAMGVGTGAAGLWAAYHGILETWGVTYFIWPLSLLTRQEPSGPCILIELDTLSKALIALIAGAVPVVLRIIEHHGLNPVLPTQPTPTEVKPT